MIQYSNEQLVTIVTLPTITILLIWTIAIFHKNRKTWGPYDIPIVSVLTLSVLRNVCILCYFLTTTLGNLESIGLEYCSVVVWLFNSIHTFQASSLTTIAVIGMFSVRLHRKQQNLKHFLTPTHTIYHLFCLTTLCACVGVAAILGQNESGVEFGNVSFFECKFMPFNLDIKFNVFMLVLHIFLSVISFGSFIIICYNFVKVKKTNFEYLKKSNSDLSDNSFVNTLNPENNYYDTYTIQQVNKNAGNFFEAGHNQSGFCRNRDINWNSDMSNISATVSSTNSRRPCLGRNQRGNNGVEENRTGLETIHPVLIVCYLFYHIPLIILCIYPRLIHPWPVSGIALWLGLIQDLLIPIGLGIVDSRFCKWVSSVYKCSGKTVEDKLPHVGLDGKFRPFGTASQPQSLEIPNPDRNIRIVQAVEHRFPITNGSLYTSIDGRLPVIHNYRRNRDSRSASKQMDKQSLNVAFHSNYLSHHKNLMDGPFKIPSCSNCEADLCPSHSNLHHLSPNYINQQLNLLQQNRMAMKATDRLSRSQESLRSIRDSRNREIFQHPDAESNVVQSNLVVKNSRNLARLNKMRLSRSEDSLNNVVVRDLGKTIIHPQSQKKLEREMILPKQSTSQNVSSNKDLNNRNDCSSSDDDYLTDVNDTNNNTDLFDSISSRSSYSITTEANCDFHFFQNNEQQSSIVDSLDFDDEMNEFFVINNVNNRPVMTSFKPAVLNQSSEIDMNKNLRITRSNSKRSLENFHLFIEDHQRSSNKIGPSLQRSSSHIAAKDSCKSPCDDKVIYPEFNMSDYAGHFNNFRPKMKSVEYLPSNHSTNFVENDNSDNKYFMIEGRYDIEKCIGSVPDLKKIFISEYI